MHALPTDRRGMYRQSLLRLSAVVMLACWTLTGQAADPGRLLSAKPGLRAEPAPSPHGLAAEEAALRRSVAALSKGEPRVVTGHPGACGDLVCQDCNPPWYDRVWVRGEALLWWTNSMGPLPALVTSSPASTAPANSGVLGNAGTAILFGGGSEDQGVHGGGRISLGYDLTAGGRDALQASYLSLGKATAEFQAASPNVPVLARPYFDTLSSQQAALLVAHPDLLQGSIAIELATEFEVAEALWRRRVLESCDGRLDFLLGYRFARLDESLNINQFSQWTATQGVIVPGTTRTLVDRFDTENEFHGALLGMVYQRQWGCTSLELLMKLGLGNTRSRVVIDGSTRTVVPGGGAATFSGGLLAQPTNIGSYDRDQFAVLPELGATLKRQLTPRLSGTIGYTFLYWSDVARPSDQIDTALSQLPPEPPRGARRPEFLLASDGFWAQGLSFGLDFRF